MKIDKLLKALYQSDQAKKHSTCPDAEKLAAYCDNTLQDQQKSVLEQHLLSCRDCLEQIVLVSESLPQALTLPDLNKTVDIVIQFIKGAAKAFPVNKAIHLFPVPALDRSCIAKNSFAWVVMNSWTYSEYFS